VARALQVQQAAEPLDVKALEAEIVALLADEIESADAIDVGRALQDIAEIWADSVDVSVDVPEAVGTALATRPSSAMAVNDVAREAVNNAVLRGGATWVDLTLRGDSRSVTITVVNRQAATPMTFEAPGFGSRIYDDLTDSWSLESVGGRVIFTAVVGVPDGTDPERIPQGPSEGLPSGVITD
jgi:hypothetical protein